MQHDEPTTHWAILQWTHFPHLNESHSTAKSVASKHISSLKPGNASSPMTHTISSDFRTSPQLVDVQNTNVQFLPLLSAYGDPYCDLRLMHPRSLSEQRKTSPVCPVCLNFSCFLRRIVGNCSVWVQTSVPSCGKPTRRINFQFKMMHFSIRFCKTIGIIIPI